MLVSCYSHVWSAETFLEFRVSDDLVNKLSLSELQRKLDIHQVQLFNPLMDKDKKYQAFSLKDILDIGFDNGWDSNQYSDITFVAADGYEATAALEKLQENGAFLAFKDLDLKQGWELVGYKQANPAPYFLIWTGKQQTTENAYPWPWQVVTINLLSFEEQYPTVIPIGALHGASSYKGFEIFRSRCMRCHSMSHAGGKVGPDLNAPQSITAYRSEHMIKEFIRHPSKYRYTQMPDHTDLSDTDLDDLYQYFLFQAKAKIKE